MDNMINGIIAAFIFIAFVAGLAKAIHEIPFILIVAVVCVMFLVDLYQSSRAGLAEEKAKRNHG